ncbi:MAG: radical SAM protein [Chloroflexota bacterium]
MAIKKITLINPPQFTKYSQPPMGLAQLAAVLEKAGYPVSIIDANALALAPRDVASQAVNSDVIGLTAMTPTINAALAIAGEIKNINPNVSIIFGGSHATLLPEETLNSAPQIDVLVRGEGETVIIELLHVLEDKRAWGNIGGISYRENGRVINNPVSSGNVDLDSLPFLAYHLLPLSKYKPHPPHGRELPFAAIITSRGCPYRCGYCSKPVFGQKFRAQNPERVVAEIAYLKEKFGVRELAIYDDVFTLNRDRVYAIAELILKRGLKICWTCETRVDLVDKELLSLMKKAGCYSVAYGVESACQEILNILNKGIALERVEEAVRITREAGLQTIGYFMLGSPGETPETINDTVSLAKKLKLDFAQFAITIPFPGTELYQLYLKNNNKPPEWESFVYEGAGERMAPAFESETLKRADLQLAVKKAYKEFYLRPSYLCQRLRQTNWGDFKVNVKGLLMLLRNIR